MSGLFTSVKNAISKLSALLATSNGSSLVGFIQTGTGAVARTVKDELRNTFSATQFGVDMTGATDSTAAFNIALSAASVLTSGGAGATITLPTGSLILSAQITVPSRVKIVGAGSRSTIINNSFAGPAFVFDGTTNGGLSNVRIGLNNNASAMGLKLITTSQDVRWMNFTDLEIAAPSLINGQTGIYAVTSGGRIITENVFQGIVLYQVSSPFNWNGPEGNFITDLTIAGFGANAPTSAIGPIGHANLWQGRVAGAPFAGSIAYSEAGARNLVDLIVDIGPSSTALNVTGTGNVIRLARPEILTPVGNFSKSTTVVDSEFIVSKYLVSQGPTPTASAFSLGSGFGNSATISNITGNDQRIRFQINASGTGMSAYPSVGYSFQNGAFPVAPVPQITRDGGNQSNSPGFGSSASVNGWGFLFGGTPVDGESYTFVVTVG